MDPMSVTANNEVPLFMIQWDVSEHLKFVNNIYDKFARQINHKSKWKKSQVHTLILRWYRLTPVIDVYKSYTIYSYTLIDLN